MVAAFIVLGRGLPFCSSSSKATQSQQHSGQLSWPWLDVRHTGKPHAMGREQGGWTRVMTTIATIWAADKERWVPNPSLSPSIASSIYNILYVHRTSKLYGTVLYPAALLGSAAFSHRCCHHLLKAKGRDLPWPLSHQDRDQELLSSSIRNTMWSGPFPYQDSCRTGFSPAGSGLFPSAGASPSAPFIEHKESISTA